jgi:hypothetical protein
MAGISALAAYTMVADDERPTYALHRDAYRKYFHAGEISECLDPGDADAKIEIWSYAPELLTESHTVDHLSLFLSLRDSMDERIQIAREELLKEFLW